MLVEAPGQVRMGRALSLFTDVHDPSHERFGLGELSLPGIELSEIFQRERQFKMVRTEDLFLDGHSSHKQRFRIGKLAVPAVQYAEIVERRRHIRMSLATDRLVNAQRPEIGR